MNRLPSSKTHRGFTFLELLIAVTVIGILAAIAIPSYRSYVQRANRTVAKAALGTLANKQESYAADHKSYASNFVQLSVSGTGSAGTAYLNRQGELSLASTNAIYKLTLKANGTGIASCSGFSAAAIRLTYVLIAEPQGNTDSKCGTICLSSAGTRGASGGVEACWAK